MHKIKINFLAIIGMMVAIGTVAFTAAVKNTTTWYEVEYDINLDKHEIKESTSAPTPFENCKVQTEGNLCKIELASNLPPPEFVEDLDESDILGRANIKMAY